MSNNLRICKKCPIEHIENCSTCAGFGIESNGTYIVACDAYDKTYSSNWKVCPECGSGPTGILTKEILCHF